MQRNTAVNKKNCCEIYEEELINSLIFNGLCTVSFSPFKHGIGKNSLSPWRIAAYIVILGQTFFTSEIEVHACLNIGRGRNLPL